MSSIEEFREQALEVIFRKAQRPIDYVYEQAIGISTRGNIYVAFVHSHETPAVVPAVVEHHMSVWVTRDNPDIKHYNLPLPYPRYELDKLDSYMARIYPVLEVVPKTTAIETKDRPYCDHYKTQDVTGYEDQCYASCQFEDTYERLRRRYTRAMRAWPLCPITQEPLRLSYKSGRINASGMYHITLTLLCCSCREVYYAGNR